MTSFEVSIIYFIRYKLPPTTSSVLDIRHFQSFIFFGTIFKTYFQFCISIEIFLNNLNL